MIVVEVKSAETARMETEKREVEISKELIEAKYKLEKDTEKFVQRLSDWVGKQILGTIHRGENYISHDIYYKEWMYQDAPDFDKAMKKLCEVYKKAGYTADFNYFSSSWQRRSGKVAKIWIEW